MRIAVGGIEHETCGFAVRPSGSGEITWEPYTRRLLRGKELEALGGSNTIVDGFVRGVREAGLEIAPLLWLDANTGPPVSRANFEVILGELLERLRQAMPVDGVLLSLHGSFAAEGIDDADGAVLTAVRKMVGPARPIMAVHDLHCNLTEEMASAANVLIVERTYPHVDMAERALHAANLMARTVRGEVRPTMAFRTLPLLWSAAKMIDDEPPMSLAVEKLRDINARPGVLSASVGVGYQWIDNPTVGASAMVVTDGNDALAQASVEELGRWVWDRRDMWQRAALSPKDALAQGAGKYPIVLADQGDNTGGGAAGDSTEILRLFLADGLSPSAILYMVDPEVAAQAISAGAGATIEVQIGGKSQPSAGPPVAMQATVRGVSDGRFIYDGPMWSGVPADVGPAAWLEQNGVNVVVISQRHQPIDLALCRSLGLDCRRMKYLSVKSTGHFRSGFGPIAGSIFNVDTASTLSHDFRRLPYTRLCGNMYPLQVDAELGW